MLTEFLCPQCSRTLERSGVVEFEGKSFPVFQCEECVVKCEMFGEEFDVALTFAVDEEGRPFDPASEDGSLPG